VVDVLLEVVSVELAGVVPEGPDIDGETTSNVEGIVDRDDRRFREEVFRGDVMPRRSR
jgi:hypothetical protein